MCVQTRQVEAFNTVKENKKGTHSSEIKNKGEVQSLGTQGRVVTGKKAGLEGSCYPPARINRWEKATHALLGEARDGRHERSVALMHQTSDTLPTCWCRHREQDGPVDEEGPYFPKGGTRDFMRQQQKALMAILSKISKRKKWF